MAFSGEYMVPIDDAQKLERELADALTGLAMLGDRHERELAEVTKQRIALAHALRSLCIAIISEEPRDITDLLKQSGAALAAVEGGSHE
jgi:ABC-type Fe3+/spermidine/putrescine transport system ATPase subunit